MRALLKYAYADFWNRPKAVFVAGFLSVYVVWFVPSLFWGWNGWSSFAYAFGDPIVLALFNALALYLISKRKRKIPLRSLFVVVPAGLFITFFEPDASSARQAGAISWNINTYHGIFIFFEVSLAFFMTAVYPFLKDVFNVQPFLLFILFLLITCFLAFVFGPDDSINKFPLWIKAVPIGLLWISFSVFMIDRRNNFIENTRVKIVDRAFSKRTKKQERN